MNLVVSPQLCVSASLRLCDSKKTIFANKKSLMIRKAKENDIARIEFRKNEVPKAAMGIREFNIIPEVVKTGSKYYVTCCYWNNWTGLNREVVEITIENNKVKKIAVIETYNLIKYHCGILY